VSNWPDRTSVSSPTPTITYTTPLQSTGVYTWPSCNCSQRLLILEEKIRELEKRAILEDEIKSIRQAIEKLGEKK